MSATIDAVSIVQELSTAVALTKVDGWPLLFENGRFFQLFPSSGEDGTLADRVPGFRPDRAAARIGEGRSFTFESESGAGGRERPIRVELRLSSDGEHVLAECTDITKEKEVQYMLDSYSSLAERNARDLEKEKEKVEKLLLNIMPKGVLEELKDYGTTTPQRFDSASIVMLDFVGFTSMAISEDPGALITELNDIFSAFDRIVEMFGCERLKTIGDAYIAVSGVPEQAPDHAHNAARAALRMRRYLERRNAAYPQAWHARIGINTGPVIGSLVGVQKYVYDLFGPGVNLAARMEAASESMRITASQYTYALLKDSFVFSERGVTEVKGFGQQALYFLEGEIGERRR